MPSRFSLHMDCECALSPPHGRVGAFLPPGTYRISSRSRPQYGSVLATRLLIGWTMEYLIVLLTMLAMHLPSLTGHPVPDMATLPSLEVAEHLEQAVFAHTGQHLGGELTTAAYMPRENLILVTTALLDDLPELEAVLVHELVHWWQVGSHRAEPRGSQVWEQEARFYENLWRRDHGLRPRQRLSPPTRHRIWP